MSDNPASSAAAGMPCPRCRVDLVMSDRQGIEIDYCPKCRGVWLDRGELDKIIERNAQFAAPSPQETPNQPAQSPFLPTQSPWMASPTALPGYPPAGPPPGWGQGYDTGHQGGHGGGHGGSQHGGDAGHNNSFLGRLFR